MGRMRRETEPSVPASAAPREPGPRAPGLRAIGLAASRVAGPIVAKSAGGVAARIKAAWPEIAGAELAAIAWPESLSAGGILRLRVIPAEALALQHRAPLLVERVNAYFGRAVAARLALIQGPLPSGPARRPLPPPIPAADAAAIDRQVAGVGDSALRAALAQLGRAIAATRRDEG